MKNKRQKKFLCITLIIMIGILIVLIYFNIEKDSISINASYNTEAEDSSWNKLTASYITFEDDKIVFEGSGATVKDNIITIKSGGEYATSGAINNGQIIIDSNETVKLILNGAEINNKNGSPIYVKNAKKTIIVLEKDTENKISDTENYDVDGGANATLFSKDDLTINGDGSLTVYANYEDGIASNNNLKIINSNIEIEAKDDGIRGKDSVNIKNATIKINSSGDGIKSTNEKDTSKGTTIIDGGTIDITSVQDGIQAEKNLKISNAIIDINSGNGSENASTTNSNWGMWGNKNSKTSDTTSAKGIKSNGNITIDSGTFNFDTSDDSIHSNETITINNGNIDISSGDDGIHADESIKINGGSINISQSYEGIESNTIDINGGNIHLITTDDGINISGGNDNSAMNRPGENNTSTNSKQKLTINDGYIYIDSKGDGLDANGSIYINGGTVIVNGPTDNGNGALDYDNEMLVNGGLLIAAGSSGMLKIPNDSSDQNILSIGLNGNANSIIHIENENSDNILTFAPAKTYQSIIISSPNLKSGKTYSIYTGGNYSNKSTDGLYTNGTYNMGTKLETVTLTDVVTQIGNITNIELQQPPNMRR